jgi:hypothetical protein
MIVLPAWCSANASNVAEDLIMKQLLIRVGQWLADLLDTAESSSD